MAFATKNTKIAKRTGYFFQGKELALHKEGGHPIKLRRHKGSWWPEKKKIECATMFAVTRNYITVKELTGVPVHALKEWTNEPWWDATIAQVKKTKNDMLEAKITEVLATGVDIIIDRFANGDVYVDHNSPGKEQYRVPIKARDVAQTAAVLFDKRQLLRGEATSRTENVSTEQKFKALKDNFEKLAKSKLINAHVEPIEVKEISVLDEKDVTQEETLQMCHNCQQNPCQCEHSIEISPLEAQ